MIAGKDAPNQGEAKNSWLSGTAAWNYVAITQWILGIRPDYDGLRISPVIPGVWDGFEATRRFRGVSYRIVVQRIGLGDELNLRMDGQPIEGNLVPHPDSGVREVLVEVDLGVANL